MTEVERQLERELATVNVYLDEAIASLKQVEAENKRLRAIIARHDAERELGRCDGLLDPPPYSEKEE